MGKRASVLSAAVLAVAGLAGPASVSAATISPAGAFTLTGTLTLRQSTTINCNVTLNGVVAAGGGSATITSGSFASGDWQCGVLAYPTGFPWAVVLNGGTSITIMGVGATTILGGCSGNITTNWINLPPPRVFMNSTIPGSPGPCAITGTLVSSPSLTVF